MRVKQADILSGLDKAFIGRLMTAGTKISYEPGAAVFNQNDPARRFYILLKGRVRLSIGEHNRSNYTINHGGEAFGWSSLAGRETYSASAVCLSPSILIVFDHDQVDRIFAEDPMNAIQFFKNLTLTLGNRLIHVTSQLAEYLSVDDNISYGTGQVQEGIELL